MLPFIALGAVVAGTVFLAGCAGRKEEVTPRYPKEGNDSKKPAEGPDPKPDFTNEDNPLAFSFYRQITRDGVRLKDLDAGFRAINYAGIHCPDKNAASCTIGAGDGVISENEVLEYVFDRSEKYRSMIESALGSPLPWTLDDLNPATRFDLSVRNRVNLAIRRLRGILKTEGIPEGSERHKEMMAVGLYYLAVTLDAADLANSRELSEQFEAETEELTRLGLTEYRNFLRAAGGLRIYKDNDTEERSALEALATKKGECTEKSKILYAIFRMADLAPEFVYIESGNIRSDNPDEEEYVNSLSENMNHVCIGLRINGKLRLFDPAFRSSNATHVDPTALTPRNYLCYDYSTRGMTRENKGELDRAMIEYDTAAMIGTETWFAHFNRGNIQGKRGNYDAAIGEFDAAIEIDPNQSSPYVNRSLCWLEKGNLDKSLEDANRAIELDPHSKTAYFNRSASLMRQNQFDAAISDLNRVIALDPKYAEAYINLGSIHTRKGDPDKAMESFRKAAAADPRNAPAYINMGLISIFQGKTDEAIEHTAGYWKVSPPPSSNTIRDIEGRIAQAALGRMNEDAASNRAMKTFRTETNGMELTWAEGVFVTSFSLWKAGKYQDAVEALRNLNRIAFVKRPSGSTRLFFEELIRHMPQDMEDAQGVKETLADLGKKMR